MYSKEILEEIEDIIKEFNLSCSVTNFRKSINYDVLIKSRRLSEAFIREFKDEIEWILLPFYQCLSLDFIEELLKKLHTFGIVVSQKLPEYFIIKHFKYFEKYIDYIIMYQELSENFIREFQDKVDWKLICIYQNLSPMFIEEFKDKIDIKEYKKSHKVLTYKEKLKKVKKYCKKYKLNLDLENKCFYAYRQHDKLGRGFQNKTIFYEKGKYYRDWHLDMRKDVKYSFGLGIFPTGDTKVKVLIEDFGIFVNNKEGACRVWGFEIV